VTLTANPGRSGFHQSPVQALAAVLLVTLAYAVPRAQGERAADVHVSDGTRRYLLGQWADGRLTLAAPCIPGPGSPAAPGRWPEGFEMTLPTAAGVEIERPRQVRIGSEEWNGVAPSLLALAGRREQEQRLAPATSTRGSRFLDWLFAAGTGAEATYYFETSRRVPSPPAPADDNAADPPSTLRVEVSGFARVQASARGAAPMGDVIPLGTKAELRWEEDGRPRGPQRPGLRPLGILRAAEPVWLLEDRSPGSLVIRAIAIGARRTNQAGATRIGRC
jgi:hypothetical protein